MTEKSEFYNLSLSDISSNDEVTNINTNNDNINIKYYPIRCSDCSNIAIFNGDFKKNYFYTKCDNQHKNEYYSFFSFLEGANKDLKNILCNLCKKSEDEVNLFKCNDCNLFFCNNCKFNHYKMNNQICFQDINKIDTYCSIHDEKYKYYNIEKKLHLCEICYKNANEKKYVIEIEKILEDKENINNEYQNAINNNLICKNIQKHFYNWLNDLTKKVKQFCETLNNYYLTQKLVLNNNNINIYNNNFNAITNYESFNKNKNNIDIYIQQINNKINIKNMDFEKMSKNYIHLLNNFNKINFSVESERISVEYINGKIKMLDENEDKSNINIMKKIKKLNKEIETMKRLKLEFNSQATSFCSLNYENNLVIGLKSGKIEIFEFIQEENFKNKLKINEFQNEIKFICELDINLFAATDGQTNIKILKLINNMQNYTVIQILNLKEDSESIYSIINLPILSYNKKRHYFCIGDENHILIWKSNKQPKYQIDMCINQKHSFYSEENEKNQNEDNNNKDETLYFTLVKDIELKTLTRCLIEVNEKYIAAACTKENTIKFFNVQKEFQLETEVKGIPASCGSNILSLIHNGNILIIGCKNGFSFISIKNLKLVKEVHCKYGVTCLETLTKNGIICCCEDRNENKIKYYKIDEHSLELKKSSEKKAYNNEIWNLKIINNRIFYTNNNNDIIYLR